jgi:hypothetical protein
MSGVSVELTKKHSSIFMRSAHGLPHLDDISMVEFTDDEGDELI